MFKGTGLKRRCMLVEDTMMYVPILETLQVLLQNEAILSEVCIQIPYFKQSKHLPEFCRLKSVTSPKLPTLRTFVMVRCANHIHSFQSTLMLSNSSSITMTWRCAIHLVLKLKSTSLVCCPLPASHVHVYSILFLSFVS